MTLRKVSKNSKLFPSDESVFKLLYLALRQYQQAVGDAGAQLERGDEPVRYPVRRQSADGQAQRKLTSTECLELPVSLPVTLLSVRRTHT